MTSTAGNRTIAPPLRIGLALSGGGFRAAIFHLGVIRRLEELGVMKYVDTISAVSGGSIVAAYYVIEMEKRLRGCAEDIDCAQRLDKKRLEFFEEIVDCFLRAVDHNLRSRALIFMPFYHPLLAIKALSLRFSRADVMQGEYDRWFYRDATLDHLPSLTWRPERPAGAARGRIGPRVILNATSLLTGQRRGFTREPVVGFRELHRVNRNVLRLSRVVGASSAFPGMFPPVTISGEKLVDGGVSDNQGIDGLIDSDVMPEAETDECGKRDGFDVLLVSDASGQLEEVHRIGKRVLTVALRTVSILQFQVRRKALRLLWSWQQSHGERRKCDKTPRDKPACEKPVCESTACGAPAGSETSGDKPACDGPPGDESKIPREFAFVHLLLNLKGRPNAPRVPTEYISALGGIRTDLDQFSFIERECLMYHGYTLIDAQIRKHCAQLREWVCRGNGNRWPAQRKPPLFPEDPCSDPEGDRCVGESRLRRRVRMVLTIGSQPVFLVRSASKHGPKAVAGSLLLPSAFIVGAITEGQALVSLINATVLPLLHRLCGAVFGGSAEDPTSGSEACGRVVETLGILAIALVTLYVLAFLTYWAMRPLVRRWDGQDYRALTGTSPPGCWK